MNPGRVALRQGDRAETYGELAARVDALAAAFAARGVGAGDRVAHLGPNDIATFETLFAATRLGAIFVPMNTRLAPSEIAALVEDCSPALLVCGAESADMIGRIGQVPPLVSIDAGAQLGDAAAFDELLARGDKPPAADVPLDADAVILYTSGTTGRPKGAVLTHANLTFNTVNQLAHLDVLSTDVVLCTAPLFHATGLSQVSLPVLLKGGTVVVAPRFEAALVLRAVGELGITAFAAVPTMLQLLVDHPDWADADLHTLRYVNYGGSPVAEWVARAWLARGVTVVQGYGMTEASPGVTMEMPDRPAEQPVSAGVPHFFTDLALVTANGETGAGELLVRSPTVFRGYWNRPADTEAAFTDGWLRTGDIARLDPDGTTYIVDRVKDLIISGGENIYPGEVEAAITALPGVLDAAVIAVPDEKWGEVGAAYVVRRVGTSLDEAAVREQLAGRLAKYKIPKHLRFVDELPRTATGKIQRARLRSEFRLDASGR
jgi:fatty-acyl-CoA synthase